MSSKKRKLCGNDNRQKKLRKLLQDSAQAMPRISSFFSPTQSAPLTSQTFCPLTAQCSTSQIIQSSTSQASLSQAAQDFNSQGSLIQASGQDSMSQSSTLASAQDSTSQGSLSASAQDFTPHAANSSLIADTQINVQSFQLDIFNDLRTLTPEMKMKLIQNRIPHEKFVFPSKLYKDKRKQYTEKQKREDPDLLDGYCRRYPQHSWFKEYTFLCWSQKEQGIACLPCRLFPISDNRTAKQFIVAPYSNWKDATSDIKDHAALDYHVKSCTVYEEFLKSQTYPEKNILNTMSLLTQERVVKNRKIIGRIIKAIEFCGRNGIALRGHRDANLLEELDGKGMFSAVVELMIDSGDTVLTDHIATAAKNASYMSKKIQNDLLFCILDYIQTAIISEVKNQQVGPMYSLMADEVSDISNKEQLGIVLRYVKDGVSIERLLEFCHVKSITGSSLCETVISVLEKHSLDTKDCKAQNYDGAGNMAGSSRGLAACFNSKEGNNAPYYHCASHDLNLVISKASKVPLQVNIMLEDLRSMGHFLNYPKRHEEVSKNIAAFNESATHPVSKTKLGEFCSTRWVEKHNTLETFRMLYRPLQATFQSIINQSNCEWDTKTRGEAVGHLTKMKHSSFIASFVSVHYLYGFTKDICKMLQGTEMDILRAHTLIQDVTQSLEFIRENNNEVFHKLYLQMVDMAGDDLVIPRVCSRSTLRSNTPADNPEDYFRKTVFLELLDCMISEMKSRFPAIKETALICFSLLPSQLDQLGQEEEDAILACFRKDMPSPVTFPQEIVRWIIFWKNRPKPTTIQQTIAGTDDTLFPNIFYLLHLILIIPVTAANVERANSALKFIKSDRRSTMTNMRLNALLSLFIHKDIVLDIDSIVTSFANKCIRRMSLINPLAD